MSPNSKICMLFHFVAEGDQNYFTSFLHSPTERGLEIQIHINYLYFKCRDVYMAMYYATNSWRRCGGMALCILDLGTRYS